MYSILIIYMLTINMVTGYVRCDIKDATTAQFRGRKNTIMNNEQNKIETVENITKHTCLKSCRTDETCLSFSYTEETSSCTLNRFNGNSAGMSLVESSGVMFYGIENDMEDRVKQSYVGRCSHGHQCLNGGSCKNDCSSKGYYCSCSDSFHGEFCQEVYQHKPVLVQTIPDSISRSSIGFEHKNEDYLIIGGYIAGVLAQVFKYSRESESYEAFTTLPGTTDVTAITSFEINNQRFVVVCNKYTGSTHVVASQIYVINDDTGNFEVSQTVTTYGAQGVSYFEASDGNRYLFISNHFTDSSYNTNSVMLVWNDETKSFTSSFSFATNGAFNPDIFEIDNKLYVGIPNYYNNANHNTVAVVYRLDSPGSWSLIQSLPESNNGATAVTSFKKDTETYIVVIRHLHCVQDANVYQWNRASEQFDVIQRIPMVDCPIDAEIFKVGREIFMITSTLRTNWSGAANVTPNVIYKLEGKVFVKYLTVTSGSTWNWSVFERDGEIYLSQVSTIDGNTKVYKWV